MSKERFSKNISISNKRARFEYSFIDTYIAGIVLYGTEIKSIREGTVNLQDAFCVFVGDKLIAKAINISHYKEGTHFNHESKRDRVLLLKKAELRKLSAKSEEKGLTITVSKLFINDRGFAKLEIALAKGKKLYDKREDIKSRDVDRDMRRELSK
ncbi:MAG TPA: SsrA-binding protein SmpB [Cytophagaceae bacterium]|jgi:SsrA-binding protein|nr:SsrA-binding protein SmpB [Cytophagaceae bacterium]